MSRPDAIARMRAAPACARHATTGTQTRLAEGVFVVQAVRYADKCDACAIIVRDAALPGPADLVADVDAAERERR